jgi:succinoglycan biosynthesis transport protein ExoP
MVAEMVREPEPGLLAQIQHYGRLLLKWKWTAMLFFALAVGTAIIYSLSLTPIYTANGTIWIENESKILPFEEVQSFDMGSNLQSHARLLRSRSLASDVIDKLKLYENDYFVGRLKEGETRPDPADPIYREEMVEKFIADVAVSSRERSRLVDVSFNSPSSKLAADVLNALFDGYIEMIVSKRFGASEQASRFLSEQITELRTEIDEKERELNEYGAQRDILPLSTAEAPSVARIGELNSRLTAATLDRINKFNVYNQLKNAPLGEIPDAPAGSLIERLRSEYINLSREYTSRSTTVRPEFPAMQRLKSDLDAATEALRAETQNLIRNAFNEYQSALQQEESLKTLLDQQKNEAYKASSNSVVYNSLRIELENKKALLEALSRRQSETDVSSRLKGLEALNVWIVDKADYPLRPAFPDKRRNVLYGLIVGLMGAVGLAFGFEYLDNSVKTLKDVTSSIGVPALGSVPGFQSEVRPKSPLAEFSRIRSLFSGKRIKKEEKKRARGRNRRWEEASVRILDPTGSNAEAEPKGTRGGKIDLIALREPRSIQAESYRSIRTTLIISSPPGKIRTILFTSPLAKEGKSATISNLGITLAEARKRVVIVDSDLRKPMQERIFYNRVGGGLGLSRYLSSDVPFGDIIQPTDIPNLHLITSGALPASPIELLTSEKMDSLVAHLRQDFDFVLFDTPPILAVSDALAMGPMADAIILIARGGQTPIPALKQAKLKLDTHKLKCFGVILNGVDLLEQDGYYAKQYYHYAKPE